MPACPCARSVETEGDTGVTTLARMGRMPKDMRKLMEQAQKMQAHMQQAQANLAEQTYEGSAGGGVVKAVVKGSGELVSVDIDPSVVDPEDVEMLNDLVVAAVNQALTTSSEAATEAMGGVAGGMDLGGLGGLLG